MKPFWRKTVLSCLAGLALAAWMATWTGNASAGNASAVGPESIPAGVRLVSLEAHPSRIDLVHRFDNIQLLLTARTDTGESVDVTRLAQFVADLDAQSQLVLLSETRHVTAAADGEGSLSFTLLGQSVTIPVKVSGMELDVNVSFVQDCMPLLSKLGCNAGTCHGNQKGQNGFKLSLRGYDPMFDHRALIDDLSSRRLNRAAPDQSLMLLKASGSIPHVGGMVAKTNEPQYALLRRWIAAGTPLDLDSPRVTRIELLPQNPVLPRAGMRQQFVVRATYSDGSVRDVTRDSFIESGDVEVAEGDEHGVITLLRRGEAAVLARYEGAYAATTVTVMGDRTGFSWIEPEQFNYVDKYVYDKLRRIRVEPGELCSDADFVRRVYLDLTGLPPTADQARGFLDDPGDTRARRAALVDELIQSGEFVEHWANKWADMLQVNRKFLGEEGSAALRNWIKQSVAANKPYDQFAREVLTASGSNLDNPPAAYWKILREPAEAMENTTHLFLATRFSCNKCHDHPFERWTQDQYYHMAAYFSQVGLKADPRFAEQTLRGSAVEDATPLVEIVYDKTTGDIEHGRTRQVTAPQFPFLHDDLSAETAPRREQLAHWMTSPKNPYFALSYVNRLWGYLFGRGIIEPIDDIRAGNPPTNPELLDALTEDFIASGFDVQHMLRTICNSRSYQHSVATNSWNEDDDINYSHALARRLPAEVLYDAIHVATGATSRLPNVPPGYRAAQLPDVGVKLPFLDDFGRPARESSCECERSTGMVLGPIMKLVNGPTVAEAVADPDNELAELLERQPDDNLVVEEIFLRFLSRRPTSQELELARQFINEAAGDYGKAVDALAAYESEIADKVAAWEASLDGPVEWQTLTPRDVTSTMEAEFEILDDQSVLSQGKVGQGQYVVKANTDQAVISAIRLEVLPHESLHKGGPGRALNGNFVLSTFSVTASPIADDAQQATIALSDARATFEQDGWPAVAAIDTETDTGWAISPRMNERHTVMFALSEPLHLEQPTALTFTFDQQHLDGLHLLGRFRLSLTDATRPLAAGALPEAILTIFGVERGDRSDVQRQQLIDHYRTLDAVYERLSNEVTVQEKLAENTRLTGVQDLAWALINSPAFLFNR